MLKLRKHKKEGAVVMDPFCGRGTTLYAARRCGLEAWGVDSSPVAAAIARAKLASCTYDEVLDLASSFLNSGSPESVPDTDFFDYAYDPKTLLDICAIREGLMSLEEETDVSVVLRAAMLGCLHGPRSKRIETAGYFSNQMPRTYASKPEYSVRFWKKKNLLPPSVNVIDVLRRKLFRIAEFKSGKSEGFFLRIKEGDSQDPKTFDDKSLNFSVVVTSPPYYGMRTYVQDQWVRYWFLGGPDRIDYADGRQVSHSGHSNFIKSLTSVWDNMGRTRSKTLDMYIRFGVIPSASTDAREIIQKSFLNSRYDWKLVSTRSAKTAAEGKRQAGQMKTKSTAAIEYDFHLTRV